MHPILQRQLAIDFCCTEEQVMSRDHVFTAYTPHPERRIFKEGECFLKIAAVNGKLLCTGKPEIVRWFEEHYKDANAAWFMEYANLRELDAGLQAFGCRVGQAHPFFVAEHAGPVDPRGYETRIWRGVELEQFRGDARFDEAFLFGDLPRDEIGVGALENGEIIGMAGATSDSDTMWQIGINVLPQAEGKGIGSMLVALLRNEILALGKLPFYGTAMSHLASQRTALRAGFTPAWCELACEPIPGQDP